MTSLLDCLNKLIDYTVQITMLNSLEVIQASGISRATLNNYIALGLLPRPLIRNPGDDSGTLDFPRNG